MHRRKSRRYSLRFGLIRLFPPLANLVLMDPAQREQLFFVIDHLIAASANERIVLHQENGFLGADLLAITAKDAAQHVDLKFPGGFFDVANFRAAWRAGRGDAD